MGLPLSTLPKPKPSYIVDGMRRLRRDLTVALDKADSGHEVIILRHDVDRSVLGKYKLVRVDNE